MDTVNGTAVMEENLQSVMPENTPAGADEVISFKLIWKFAAASLKGHWACAILTTLVPMFIGMAVNQIPFAALISGILLFPLTVGVMLFFLRLVRNENPRCESVFEPFRQYGRMLWGYCRVAIFVFLHFLLLIIPGYVALLRYSLTYYIMLDNPECSVREAMIMSRNIMYEHKWQMFGYMLLCLLIALPIAIFTLGIGLLWYGPFIQAFNARYYELLRKNYERKQSI